MNLKHDFIVIAEHGTGVNFFYSIMNNMCSNILQYYDDSIKLQKNIKKGILIDKKINDNDINEIIRNTTDPYFFVLTRDPILQLVSIINTHIDFWIKSCVGLYDMDIPKTLMYRRGNKKSLFISILYSIYVSTMKNVFCKIIKYSSRIIFYDINDFSPEMAKNSFSDIVNMLFDGNNVDIDIPDALMFSKENRFYAYIKHLNLTLNTGLFSSCFGMFSSFSKNKRIVPLRPCPLSFCHILNREDRILFDCDPHEISFDVGNFTGNIAFVAGSTEEILDIKQSKKNTILNKNRMEINKYCKNMSERYNFAKEIENNIKLTTDDILFYAMNDKEIYNDIKKHIMSHVDIVSKYFQVADKWECTFDFLNKL